MEEASAIDICTSVSDKFVHVIVTQILRYQEHLGTSEDQKSGEHDVFDRSFTKHAEVMAVINFP